MKRPVYRAKSAKDALMYLDMILYPYPFNPVLLKLFRRTHAKQDLQYYILGYNPMPGPKGLIFQMKKPTL